MTAEEMEIAYCKARRTCMKSFRMWLREHIAIADDADSLGLTPEQVKKITIAAMRKAEAELSKELDGKVDLISEVERQIEFEAAQEEPAESGTV